MLTVTTVLKAASQNNSDQIIGSWMSAENILEVEIFKAGGNYNAKVVWIDDSDDKCRSMNTRCDSKNPDENLRTRKIIDMEIMYGLVYKEMNNDWGEVEKFMILATVKIGCKGMFYKKRAIKSAYLFGFSIIGKGYFI